MINDPNADYYTVLGVTRDATTDEIKLAARKLSTRYYTDKREEPDHWSEFVFRRINEARETLEDPERRAEYDRQMAAEQGGSPPPVVDQSFFQSAADAAKEIAREIGAEVLDAAAERVTTYTRDFVKKLRGDR